MTEKERLEAMGAIMDESAKETISEGIPPLDDDIKAVAEVKRKTFDLPTNAVKVDPLR